MQEESSPVAELASAESKILSPWQAELKAKKHQPKPKAPKPAGKPKIPPAAGKIVISVGRRKNRVCSGTVMHEVAIIASV